MDFLDQLKSILDSDFNVSVTENMALGYRTSGQNLLDLNFAVASLRGRSAREITDRFIKAYFDDRKTALVWLFYARDARGGLGERRLFRVIFEYLAENNEEIPVGKLLSLIPEYGRYDDLFLLLETKYRDELLAFIRRQLESDLAVMANVPKASPLTKWLPGIKDSGEKARISLLAKWLPSINASSETTRANGKLIAQALGLSNKEYRQTLSKLRAYIDVVECKMSAGRFGEIKYDTVPSRANLIYKDAFLRRDEARRTLYLDSLKKGETKINAAVLFPHEIVHAYVSGDKGFVYDETLEQLWQALPDIPRLENTIVVADGSGSMTVSVGGGKCSALSVANALAIYFAEKSSGPYKDQYITFSENPQLVDLSKGRNLKERIQIALAHSEVANTDIYKVFMLILHTAVKHKLNQSGLPGNIVIISDMEFDFCAVNADERLFTQIAKDYANHGYKLPRLIFWNVNSRTGTVPVKENGLGVALVSGFSISIAKMVMSMKLDPYECLLDILNDERYDPVREAVGQIV